MKKLQNNFTTPEQSKRLLELGVPAWTADIMFDKNRRRYELIETEDESWAETQRTLFYNGGAIPHWTAGRLIEIFEICTGQAWQNEIIENYSKVDMLLEDFEDMDQKYTFDFSKLEE